jgi:hypothetical protein
MLNLLLFVFKARKKNDSDNENLFKFLYSFVRLNKFNFFYNVILQDQWPQIRDSLKIRERFIVHSEKEVVGDFCNSSQLLYNLQLEML